MAKVTNWESLSHEELVEVVKNLYSYVERLAGSVQRLNSAHAVYGGCYQ